MPTIVNCPSCSRKLRVPDDLIGKKVKCPTCSGTFDAVVESAPATSQVAVLSSGKTEASQGDRTPSTPPTESLSPGGSTRGADATPLAKEDATALANPGASPLAKPDPTAPTDSYVPNFELPKQMRTPPSTEGTSPALPARSETPSAPPSEQETLTHPASEPAMDQDLEPCPYCGEKIAKDATRCQFCGEELTEADKADRPWDREYRPYRDVRRDSEPHRGTLILTLGIISIVITAASACTYGAAGFIGLIMGVCVWVMGQRDLKKMRANQMDPQGLGTTQAGWICGIIGTVLGALATLFCGVMAVFFIVMMQSTARMTPSTPAPVTKPAGPMVRPAPAKAPAPAAPAPPAAKKDEDDQDHP